MGLFKKEKEIVYPFSGFEGQLLFMGEPAANAKITRKYEQLGGDKFEETIVSDYEGRFSFDSVKSEFKVPILAPVDYISYQDVFVDYGGSEYHIWTAAKRQKEEYSEFNDSRRVVQCEITEEPHSVEREKGVGLLVTNCFWNEG